MGTDRAIDLVKQQIRDFYKDGFELGLHLHPQWYNARHENGKWRLDYSEYNLCTLTRERIGEIVDRSIAYFRELLGVPDFTPLVFRAGNWLFKPTRALADVLALRGIRMDTSVFKGGVRHQHQLDYRPALKNGYYWRFKDDVNLPDAEGDLLELPIHTEMVPFWKMVKPKRVNTQHIGISAGQSGHDKVQRLFDFLRFWHPFKLDFCCMTLGELTRMADNVIRVDQEDPTFFKPVVAIGHTKELVDFETIESFLSYLQEKGVRVSTFQEVYDKCK